jgi:hypothetical protein
MSRSDQAAGMLQTFEGSRPIDVAAVIESSACSTIAAGERARF